MEAVKKQSQEPTQAIAKQPEMNQSERFTAMVMKEFGNHVGQLEINETMRQLIQGYFVGIDRALKLAEAARLRKTKNQDPTPVTWANVNLNDLALDVMYCARVGLDMSLDNHLFAIPYKNNKSGKYDITLMQGYNGIKYIADMYAMDIPTAVTVELVYSTDLFAPIKRSRDNNIETYMFEITNPFDRGNIIGGFGYIEYENPSKNKLILMSISEIEKRKPRYASAEFWGGTKLKWDGSGEETLEGWYPEMCLKTIKREVYGAKHMPRDPRKIDDVYRHLKQRDLDAMEAQSRSGLDGYADADIIDITPREEVNNTQAAIPAPMDINPDKGDETLIEQMSELQHIEGMEF